MPLLLRGFLMMLVSPSQEASIDARPAASEVRFTISLKLSPERNVREEPFCTNYCPCSNHGSNIEN
eukprot:6457351-Amphidinium_carterae.2